MRNSAYTNTTPLSIHYPQLAGGERCGECTQAPAQAHKVLYFSRTVQCWSLIGLYTAVDCFLVVPSCKAVLKYFVTSPRCACKQASARLVQTTTTQYDTSDAVKPSVYQECSVRFTSEASCKACQHDPRPTPRLPPLSLSVFDQRVICNKEKVVVLVSVLPTQPRG